jgi:hypothetical protein
MRTFFVFLILALFSIPSVAHSDNVDLFPPSNESSCFIYSYIFKAAAIKKQQKITSNQAARDIEKQILFHDKSVLAKIIYDVYVLHYDKGPEWIEGYAYGVCLAGIASKKSDRDTNTYILEKPVIKKQS